MVRGSITSAASETRRRRFDDLERAIDALPEADRAVFMLRDVNGMNTNETASALALGDEAVKTRLHRARAMLRRSHL